MCGIVKRFKITFGSGLAWTYIRFVDVEDFESEQDAVDTMIDQLEKDKEEGCFLTQDQIDSGDYYEDEYITGGNHGLFLHHHGVFNIEEVS